MCLDECRIRTHTVFRELKGKSFVLLVELRLDLEPPRHIRKGHELRAKHANAPFANTTAKLSSRWGKYLKTKQGCLVVRDAQLFHFVLAGLVPRLETRFADP